MVLGTPAYMSYEQASGMKSDELDARSDIYSLGVVVYEMLSGRVPFHSDTPLGYLRQHMLEEPPPLRTVAQGLGVPPAVESAVMKALAKDRDQRYASVLDFARELASAAQLPAPAETPTPFPSTQIMSPPARPPSVQEPAAPMPPPVIAQAKADTAAQTPPPASPGRTGEPPSAQPQSRVPVAAIGRPPAVAGPQQFRTILEPPSRVKFVVIAAVALILIVAGAWYFSQHGSKVGEISSPGKAVPSFAEFMASRAKVNPKDGLKYVWSPPGSFWMGCSPGDTECDDGENPLHQVTITKGFWLGQTEVTVGAYKRFAGATGRHMPVEPFFEGRLLNPGWGNEAMPIVGVTWDDAQAYCGWAGGRLPTEAEWEYAARAVTTAARYDDLDAIAWYADNSGRQRFDSTRFREKADPADFLKRLSENGNGLHEVGQKRANSFGLFDMLGNVWEWVNDWYDKDYYRNSPSQDPAGPATGTLRALRGGSWSSGPWVVRVSYRCRYVPSIRYGNIGFRCGGEVFAP